MIAMFLAILPFVEPVVVERCDKLEINTVYDCDCGERRFTQVILWRLNHRGSWSVDKWKIVKQPAIRGNKCVFADGENLREI